MRATITALIRRVQPCDALEQQHITTTLHWLDSGAPLWRIQKPATPPMHLVSYFVVVDLPRHQLLLVDHKLAQLWLPPGGHGEPGEHPADTVRREMREELAAEAQFLFDDPVFVTVTQTVGETGGHTDVSLWYVLHGKSEHPYVFDTREFQTIAWFPLDDLPRHRAEPHLARFGRKLTAVL